MDFKWTKLDNLIQFLDYHIYKSIIANIVSNWSHLLIINKKRFFTKKFCLFFVDKFKFIFHNLLMIRKLILILEFILNNNLDIKKLLKKKNKTINWIKISTFLKTHWMYSLRYLAVSQLFELLNCQYNFRHF